MTFDDLLKNKPLHIQNLASNLRKLILSIGYSSLEEHIYSWDKIKISLFHLWDKNNVIFWLQPTDKNCILYLHQSDKIDTTWYTFDGNTSTKSLKFQHPGDVKNEVLLPLLKKLIEAVKLSMEPDVKITKEKKVSQVVKKITLDNPKVIMRKKKS